MTENLLPYIIEMVSKKIEEKATWEADKHIFTRENESFLHPNPKFKEEDKQEIRTIYINKCVKRLVDSLVEVASMS